MNAILNLLIHHQNNDLGFVIYRNPDERGIHYLSGKHLPNEDVGFIFAPFNNSLKASVFLQENIHFQAKTVVDLLLKINTLETKNTSLDLLENIKSTTKKEYQNAYKIIEKAIQEGKIDKAILSKINTEAFQLKKIDELVPKLMDTYPSAFCYVFFHPTSGLWIGASPELILKQDNNNFETTSLAGTKKSVNEDWGVKENEEQKIVTEFIINELKTRGYNFTLHPIKTISAGKILHLQQKINFTVPATKKGTSSVLDIVKQLHPTPAIGGYPKEKALTIIKQAEKHDRSYYCGYLGHVRKNKCALYVNLRCAQITSDKIWIYTGGGITVDSNCEQEWLECENKAQTILDLL